jgi:hypothetical protein
MLMLCCDFKKAMLACLMFFECLVFASQSQRAGIMNWLNTKDSQTRDTDLYKKGYNPAGHGRRDLARGSSELWKQWHFQLVPHMYCRKYGLKSFRIRENGEEGSILQDAIATIWI